MLSSTIPRRMRSSRRRPLCARRRRWSRAGRYIELDPVVGLAAAILAGIATAVVLESRNPKVVQWRDLAMIDNLPVLGVVPKTTRHTDASSTSPALASVARTVSTTLLQQATGARPIVAVTSVSPEGGRHVHAGARVPDPSRGSAADPDRDQGIID